MNLTNLAKKMTVSLEIFEENNIDQLSMQIRRIISQFEILSFFLKNSEINELDKYIILRGYCEEILLQLHKENSVDLWQEIENILEKEIVDKQICINAYKNFAKMHPKICDELNNFELRNFEFQKWLYEFNSFENTLNQYKEIHLTDENYKRIMRDFEMKSKEFSMCFSPYNKNIDANYGKIIFRKANQLLKNPTNPRLHKQFQKVTNNNQICKKMCGVALVFLGATIAAAGLLIYIASWGLGTISLLGAGIAGVSLIGFGVKLFKKSNAQKINETLSEFSKVLDQNPVYLNKLASPTL